MTRFLPAALAWLLLGGPAAAQRVPVLDTAFTRLQAGPPGPALAMAVLYRGRIVYQNVAGYADLERAVPATIDTRFDVASLAKQFTAFALARLVEEGRIAPGDPVDRYLPGLDLGGARVTIGQLVHHTSGLEDADGLMVLAGWYPGDPVHHASLVDLLLRQQHLRFAPGERHFYSNGGYLLLAEIVARVAGTTFSAYTDSTIFHPLGMHASGFPADHRQPVPRRAVPYERRTGTSEYLLSRVDSYQGAGGLNTTVGDLLLWARHLIRPVRDSGATMRLRQSGVLNNGEVLDYAWGLGRGRYRGREMLAHAGSGPATEAQLLVIPELDFAAVVVASGPTGVNPSGLAFRAADALLGNQLGPVPPETGQRAIMMTEEMLNQRPEESDGVSVPAERLARLTGTYLLGENPPMVIRARGDRLEFGWGGRAPYIPLSPLPDGRFVMMPLWDVYRFVMDSAGRATGIVRERAPKSVRRGGPERLEGIRIPDAPPLDSAAAAPYVGWYYGDEVGTFYRISLREGALELSHSRLGQFRLTPLQGEEFAVESRVLAKARFARNGNQVIGLELEAVSWSVTSVFRKLSGPP